MDNFPEAKSSADRIALKAAELLDRDEWDTLEDERAVVRGVLITYDSKADSVRVRTDVSDSNRLYLHGEYPAAAFREIVWSAVQNAQRRCREKLLVVKAAQIENDNHRRDLRNAKRRKWALRIAGGVGALVLAGYGVRSCVDMNARAEAASQADLNRVNEYGFRKGDLQYAMKYPQDCGRYNAPSGLASCRTTMERWEQEGQTWVDWEAAP